MSAAKEFKAAEVTVVPVSSGERQQNSPAEGHWRRMWRSGMAGGQDGSAAARSSPCWDSSKHQGRKGSAHLCRTQTSAVPPGAFPLTMSAADGEVAAVLLRQPGCQHRR